MNAVVLLIPARSWLFAASPAAAAAAAAVGIAVVAESVSVNECPSD